MKTSETNLASTIRTKNGTRSDDNFVIVGTLRTFKDGNGFREMSSGLTPTLQARARNDGRGQPVIVQRARGKNAGGVHILSPTISSNSFQDNNHYGRRFKEDGDPSFTLTAQDKHGIYNGVRIRKLTPVECERLQGFPDGLTEYGMIAKDNSGLGYDDVVEVSDTQRYKTLGNAVTVNVIRDIIIKMIQL